MDVIARQGASATRWWVIVTLAEACGFLVPAAIGIATAAAGIDDSRQALLLVAGGAIEGLLLGAGQAWAFPVRIRRARFAAWTALGAAFAWASAMAIRWLATQPAIPTAVSIGAGSCLALLSLLGMGTAQWLELRHHSPNAHRWIAWTALAWLLALPFSFAPSPFVDEATPLWLHVLLWGTSGLWMASAMALVTWQGVRRVMVTGERTAQTLRP